MKRMVLSEDLSLASYRKFKELLKDDPVAKVWTLSGSI